MSRSAEGQRLSPRAVLTALLLFGAHGTTGCGQRASPQILTVEKGEIERLNDGSFLVSEGWMLRRLRAEAALRSALRKCQDGRP